MLDVKRVLGAIPKAATDEVPRALSTPWGETVAAAAGVPVGDALNGGDGAVAAAAEPQVFVPRAEHPNPLFARESWTCLNGWWDCAFAPCSYDPVADAAAVVAGATKPPADDFNSILVPFSPEADLSGVRRQLQPAELLWYSRRVDLPTMAAGRRCLLHFEGVDDTCAVFVSGVLVATHQSAYEPFVVDITDALEACASADADAATFALDVCVVDPSDAGIQLRGKQKLARGNIWYTAQSGIWQPVWLEVVPEAYIVSAELAADARTGTVTVTACTTAPGRMTVEVRAKGKPVQTRTYEAAPQSAETLTISEPHLWSPEDPFLYDVTLRFAGAQGAEDVVRSYFAFRTVEVRADERGVRRCYLNGEPLFLKGVLNQGYWPESLMTAPADEALMADIEAMRGAGFNMLRQHIKVESARFYYHCDRLGMLVWQDMVTGGGAYSPLQTMFKPTLLAASWHNYDDTKAAHQQALGAGNARYRDLWTETAAATIQRLRSHPSIITWVLFNEGWGQFDATSACEMTRRLDATRPVHAVSGWYDQGAGDFFGVHNYFRPQTVFEDPQAGKGGATARASVTCEFGGLVMNVPGHAQLSRAYGYDVYETLPAYQAAVKKLLAHMDGLEAKGLAGYVYTQVSDIEEETNGILTYDRKVNKLD